MKHKRLLFSIIKNGIINGYPFVESYGSWLDYCDKIVILDGGSTDGTDIVLKEMSKMFPKIEVRSAPWPKSSQSGRAIAEFTDLGFSEVRPQCENLIYMQADELMLASARRKMSEYAGNKIVQICRYVLFWNSFNRVLTEDKSGRLFAGDVPGHVDSSNRSNSVEWKSFRIFPDGVVASSKGDGLSFNIGEAEFESWNEEVFHYGWCFPVNILQKHVSHLRLYSEVPIYQTRAQLSAGLLKNRNFDPKVFDLMDPQYINCAREFWGEHMACVQHLLPMKVYDPYVGLSLLRSGVRW